MTTAPPEDPRPAPAAAIALARTALDNYKSDCFWFRADTAPVETMGEVRLIIQRLRQYGGREAWYAAYAIEQCL